MENQRHPDYMLRVIAQNYIDLIEERKVCRPELRGLPRLPVADVMQIMHDTGDDTVWEPYAAVHRSAEKVRAEMVRVMKARKKLAEKKTFVRAMFQALGLA